MKKETRFDNHYLIDNRQIRIFLSSTFSDMQEERTELVKTFEILKVEAAKRNVALSVVDLRWGITEEEAKSGKVISVCLEEIEHSHPFFIGILGNNYGTAPKRDELKKNPELLERYEWLNDVISDDEEKGMSITEMEIQYGVLKNNDDIDAAFYFRESDELDNNERLTHLKDDIRKYCHSKGREDLPREYSTVSELCDYVMKEVRNVINKHFPETKEVTLLDRERSAQKAYINSRHSYYYERRSYFDLIDGFVRNHSQQHLVFTGASGIGKSALLANWLLKNEKNPDFNFIYHFVGNSFSGNNYESILRHICDEIYDLYDIRKDGNLNEKIEEEAQRLVAEVSQRDKQLVIIIDGINQIVTQGPGKEKLLLWLPSANKNVKYIFSTLPDDETMETFKRREYKVEKVSPLSKEELNEWIPKYIKHVGKSFDDEKKQLQRIVKWALNDVIQGNMLVLRTLLDELTRFGVYEKVDERIDYYTSATSIPEFFDRVLSCLEKDYSPEKDLVKHALILIAVSEHGLSEVELMTILGCKGHPLEWNLFFCAFYNHFVVKNGLIAFSHQYIVEAISKRYHIDEVTETNKYRNEIIGFFSGLSREELHINRIISELAHQYYCLSEWRNLYDILLSFDAFRFYFSNNQTLLGCYWRALIRENAEQYSLESFKKLSTSGDAEMLATYYNNIGFFIENFINNYELSLSFYTEGLKHIRKDTLDYAAICNNIGGIYEILELYQPSIQCYLESLRVKKKLFGAKSYEVALAYNNIGYTYCQMGDNDNALYWLDEALKLKIEIFGIQHPSIALTYGNIGRVYFNKKMLNDALQCFLKAKNIEENMLGVTNPSIASTYDNIGVTYQGLGEFEKSEEYHKKALQIFKKIYENGHVDLADSYINIGSLYYEQAETISVGNVELYQKALRYFEEALPIYCDRLGESSFPAKETKRCIAEIRRKLFGV